MTSLARLFLAAAKFGPQKQQLFKAAIVIVDDIVGDLLQADIPAH